MAKRRLAIQERVNNSASTSVPKGVGAQWLFFKNRMKGASMRAQQFKGKDLLQKLENSCMMSSGPGCALPPRQSSIPCGISVESHHKNHLYDSSPLGHWGQCGLLLSQPKQHTIREDSSLIHINIYECFCVWWKRM